MVSSRTFYNVLSQRTSIFQSWHPLIPHSTFAARFHRTTPVVESQPCHASVVPNIIQRFQTVKTLFLSPHIIFPVWRAQTFHHWKAFTHIWRQGGLGSAKLPRDSDLSNKWLRQGEAAISRLRDKLSIRNRWVLRVTSSLWFYLPSLAGVPLKKTFFGWQGKFGLSLKDVETDISALKNKRSVSATNHKPFLDPLK